MSRLLGLDVGTTATKAVLLEAEQASSPMPPAWREGAPRLIDSSWRDPRAPVSIH